MEFIVGSGNASMNNGPMINPMPMHSPLGGTHRMNGNMPVNPSQQSPHLQMVGPPNMNANASMLGSGPNMISNNSNGNNSSVNINNNSPNHSVGNQINSNAAATGGGGGGPNPMNSIPGSNNNGPNPSSNNSNINQNSMISGHPGMNSPIPMMGPMGMNSNSAPNTAQMYGGPKPMPVSAGKIYPADTPMVFNPQNPNAPPIYPCGVCHKEVHDNDQGLLCESGCNFWFHR
jgi:hypothetical protein